jgi:hypothetical protein
MAADREPFWRIEVGGMISFTLIGALMGVLIGILFARQWAITSAAGQTVAHRTGAIVGALLGLMAGYLRNRFVEERARRGQGLGTAPADARPSGLGITATDRRLILGGLTLLVVLFAFIVILPATRHPASATLDLEARFRQIEKGMSAEEVRTIMGTLETGSVSVHGAGISVRAPEAAEYECYWTFRGASGPGHVDKLCVFFDTNMRVVDKELLIDTPAKDKRQTRARRAP